MNRLLKHISQRSKTEKISFFLGVMVLIIGCGYQLAIQDLVEELNHLQTNEAHLKTDFEFKQSQLFDKEAYQQQIKMLHRNFTQIEQQFVRKEDLPNLLAEISKIGLIAGVKFELFAPQAERTHPLYTELPIKVVVIGNYSQLTLFLKHLSSMTRIVTLSKFTVKRAQKKDAADELIMPITLSIYLRVLS